MTTSTLGLILSAPKAGALLAIRLTAMSSRYFQPMPTPTCMSPIIRGTGRPWLAVALICVSLMLGACSAARFGYGAAPDLLYLWLDSYMDFDKSQSRRVQADLQALHRWHRSEELPLIGELLQDAQTLALQNPDGPRLCVLYDEVRQRSEALMQRMLPSAAAVVPTLKSEQVAALAKSYEKSNRKMRQEWQDARSQGLELRTRKSLDRMEDLYGKLSAEQTQAFKEAMAQTGFDEKRYFEELQARQQAVLQTLERLRGADASNAQSALADLAQRYYQSANPAYRQYHTQMTANTCVAFAKLHSQTSAEQRKHMVRVLKGYESDVRALAAQKD
jgi:hypothetical protein